MPSLFKPQTRSSAKFLLGFLALATAGLALYAYLDNPPKPSTLPSHTAATHPWTLEDEGRARADADWKSHQVVAYIEVSEIVTDFGFPTVMVDTELDPDSGFRAVLNHHAGWQRAYAARVAELVNLYGKPSWASPRFPKQDNLLNDYRLLPTAPIRLPRPGTVQEITSVARAVTRFMRCAQLGPMLSSAYAPFICVCPLHLRMPPSSAYAPFICDENTRIFITEDQRYPDILFVQRMEAESQPLYVISKTGHILAQVRTITVADIATGVRQ